MKSRTKESKRRAPHARRSAASAHRARKPARAHRGQSATKSNVELVQEGTVASRLEEPRDVETFTPQETGRPDRDEGRGPLGQEGEGEAQNDQLASLEETEPEEGADI